LKFVSLIETKFQINLQLL